jgi:hypothetical protein
MSRTRTLALKVADDLNRMADEIRRVVSDNPPTDGCTAECVVHEVLWGVANLKLDFFFREVERDRKAKP